MPSLLIDKINKAWKYPNRMQIILDLWYDIPSTRTATNMCI